MGIDLVLMYLPDPAAVLQRLRHCLRQGGIMAFQEIDITGITMPITKHNVIVTRAEDIARTIREAFLIAGGGRPGPVLVDITKDAQQASAEFNWEASAPKLPPKRRRDSLPVDLTRWFTEP